MFALALLAALEVAAEAGAGARGEARAAAQLRSEEDGTTWALGVESASGPGAPLRTAFSGAFDGKGFLLDARVVPGSAGFWAAGGIGLRFREVALTLRGKTGSLEGAALRGAGLRAEWEHELSEATRLGLSAEAWALSLSTALRGDAWVAYGQRSLDWSQRAGAGVWLAHDFGAFTLAPSLEAALPPQEGAFEVRGGLALEVPVGVWRLRAQAAVARAVPALWLGDVAAGASRPWP